MLQNINEQKNTLSFEVFPPKKDGEFQTAFATLDKLGALAPAFISVTYGAGGSNSGKTVEIASYIQNRLHLPALAHITCVGSKREALREVEEDLLEGADLIIAKPAMAYMDIIKDITRSYNVPVVAYNVSGEYSMVKAAAENGWIDERKIVLEILVGLKRAGAKMIITYHALDAAKWIREGE